MMHGTMRKIMPDFRPNKGDEKSIAEIDPGGLMVCK
jgi:hypothetical protein